MNINTKKLCKIICALCLGLPLAYFLLLGNFTLAAISGIAIQLLFCGAMMLMMMKMMGCNDKKEQDKAEPVQLKDTENKQN
ncbi:hypothetical protein PE36_03606 [Moritella sp. PE36]|uniref:DUF2933 domain-containing protein n=1 Tax=Moritella sp. PE36 TaxID=58051 RepID=UPI0001568956|nr:DUF2933 domain-containing protein [Moritella sp. PE36]EDM68479.1 hypothetical protein PE36_03606 [Moritella sp. PE36]